MKHIVDKVFCMSIFDRSVKSRMKLEDKLKTSIFRASKLHYTNKYVVYFGLIFYALFVVAACKGDYI